MPSRNDSPPPPTEPTSTSTTTADTPLCKRCNEREVAISVRTEPVCKTCFCKYVQTKIVKRLETFRVKNSQPGKERTLLVPLSFGPSSTALLRVLSRHLKGQIEKTGRTGFKLHVLHVFLPGDDRAASVALLEKVKDLYPEHTYSTLALSSVVSDPELASSLLPATLQETLRATLEAATTTTTPPDLLFQSLLATLPTPTSRRDTQDLLLRKLITHYALSPTSETTPLPPSTILYSSTTTALSEKILSETSKGRGSSLPWTVADGDSPLGVQIYFPLREVLRKEIRSYIEFVAEGDEPRLEGMVLDDGGGSSSSGDSTTTATPTMMKNSTIDDLTRQYFASIEADYPSIVANVVRTTGKLQARTLAEVEAHCELCGLPLEGGRAPERSRLCYGCIRTMGG